MNTAILGSQGWLCVPRNRVGNSWTYVQDQAGVMADAFCVVKTCLEWLFLYIELLIKRLVEYFVKVYYCIEISGVAYKIDLLKNFNKPITVMK